jgi:hypothetical protein
MGITLVLIVERLLDKPSIIVIFTSFQDIMEIVRIQREAFVG